MSDDCLATAHALADEARSVSLSDGDVLATATSALHAQALELLNVR